MCEMQRALKQHMQIAVLLCIGCTKQIVFRYTTEFGGGLSTAINM